MFPHQNKSVRIKTQGVSHAIFHVYKHVMYSCCCFQNVYTTYPIFWLNTPLKRGCSGVIISSKFTYMCLLIRALNPIPIYRIPVTKMWFSRAQLEIEHAMLRCEVFINVWYRLGDLAWWRHQMETFSALLALCEGYPSVTGGFPSLRLVTGSFDVFFHMRLNKRLSNQLKRMWF